ncbi:MAG: sulfite exporter TauE/SafE family protein [Cyclobacteriaceae bacterium]
MEIIIISIAAFLTAILTFFSGFGLGTILTPIFAIFFPIDLAIALTGVVHFINNLFKIILVGKNARKAILIRFGIPAILAAFLGAWTLSYINDWESILTYSIGEKFYHITPIKLVISLVLIFFSIFDLVPFLSSLQFDKNKMPIGGFLSGFFGGLSGHQGALRSAFLIRAGLDKNTFIGTSVVIACFIDFTRLSVYSTRFVESQLQDNLMLVVCAGLSAIAGAIIGKRLLTKVTLGFVQKFVAIALIIISVLLGIGII